MISIIIPVYNEEKKIKEILENLLSSDGNNIEIIVVDGGSIDSTAALSRQYPVKLIRCIKNRALQMNEGAYAARGDILLFLHSDCLLERQGLTAIGNFIKNGYIGGCLSQRINSNRLVYRIIESSGNIRARLFKIFYGDQAIFVRRDIFLKVGGFYNEGLFEDVILSRKLKREGRTAILKEKVYSSARRWQAQGLIKTTLINWLLTTGFFLGFSGSVLKKIYDDIR